ncbi:MAG: DUF2207 domain-containing protein [Methylococcaceae bacterium]|nr:DUF2207 domain-containing protein [Methylococcaceae bacterium]
MKKIILLSILFLLLTPQSVLAKDSFYWEFINVEIDIQENGDLVIKEAQQYVFDRPYTPQRYRWISLNGLDSITDISVTENGKPLNIKAYIKNNQQWVTWRKAINPPERQLFILKYRVIGGLSFHEGGDQLRWPAIFKHHAMPINKAKVTVKLPASLARKIQSYPRSRSRKLNAQTIEFEHENPLTDGQGMNVFITFTHGIITDSTEQQSLIESVKSPVSGAGLIGLIALFVFIALLGHFFSRFIDHTKVRGRSGRGGGYGSDGGSSGGDVGGSGCGGGG